MRCGYFLYASLNQYKYDFPLKSQKYMVSWNLPVSWKYTLFFTAYSLSFWSLLSANPLIYPVIEVSRPLELRCDVDGKSYLFLKGGYKLLKEILNTFGFFVIFMTYHSKFSFFSL